MRPKRFGVVLPDNTRPLLGLDVPTSSGVRPARASSDWLETRYGSQQPTSCSDSMAPLGGGSIRPWHRLVTCGRSPGDPGNPQLHTTWFAGLWRCVPGGAAWRAGQVRWNALDASSGTGLVPARSHRRGPQRTTSGSRMAARCISGMGTTGTGKTSSSPHLGGTSSALPTSNSKGSLWVLARGHHGWSIFRTEPRT